MTVQVLLLAILLLGLLLLIWSVAALRASIAATNTLPWVGVAVGPLLSVASIAVLAFVGMRGGGRQPPVRVSDVGQQGDVRPTSLVAGSRVWAAAQWTTASPGYALVRYSAGQPAKPVGAFTEAEVQHLEVQTRDNRDLVYHVLTGDTRLRIWDQGLRVLPQANDGADHLLKQVLDLSVGQAPALLLGHSKNAKGESLVGICRVANDGKTYTALPSTFAAGTAGSHLFCTGYDNPNMGYVAVNGPGHALRIYARDGTLALEQVASSVYWLRIVQDEVFAAQVEKEGDEPSLWSNKSGRIDVANPEHFTGCAAGLFVVADHDKRRAVFQLAAGKGLVVEFDGAGNADRIHGMVTVNGTLTVVASHGKECGVWEYNDTKLVRKSLSTELPVGMEPRLVTANDEELTFFDKTDTLWVVDAQGNTKGYVTQGSDVYAPSSLVMMADHLCFVSRDRATGKLCLYSSYFK